jgi:RND superfamily putative drug exporter
VQAPDVTAPRVQSAIATLKRRALATGVMKSPIRTSVNPRHTVETVDIPLVGIGQDAAAVHALAVLRNLTSAPVTGETAGDVDFAAATRSHMPIVFGFVLALAFLLLLVTFRSIVIPIKAIALNLLSVGASYGVLVWVFQDGHLQGLLGFRSDGGIVTWLPLFLFTVLFGLSMDYHVFILSRIKELVDRGVPTEKAVEQGIRTTASTVTSAAFVMVAVFSIFATLSTLDMKQLGVGLAVAVFLDATIIRGVLLPATMKLLGRWNWYLPRSLHWLPRLHHEPARVPATEAG